MGSSRGSFSVGGNEQDRAHNSRLRSAKKLYRRHSSHQIARLEASFKICPHPNESIRRQLGLELGLEPRQVKFWFQNKRTQAKAQIERKDNTALRHENERMLAENFIIREALKNMLCLSCGGPTSGDEESELRMHKLRLENAHLKQEHQRLSQLLASYNVTSPMFQQHVSLSSPTPAPISSFSSRTPLLNLQIEIPSLCQQFHTLCQHTSTPSLDQRVPTLAQHTHALGGQHILALDQGVPVHNQHIVPVHDQHMVPVHDQHTIPALNQDVPVLDQDNVLALAPALEKDNVPALPAPLDQDNAPALDPDFSSVLGNSNDDMLPVPPALDPNFSSVLGNSNDDMLPGPVSVFTDEERGKIEETAAHAMEELARLLGMNEPFWFRSTADGKFILQRESYDKIFHKANRLKGPRVRRESSKDSRLVIMNGTQLVDMFLDSEKWASLFPTIVKSAYTIEVLDSGLTESRSGALQLMYAEMHILSPMVPSREFFFLRYCIQVDVGAWVIADVSFDSSKFSTTINSPAWRLPSGCLFHDMNDGSCRVTWVEHVEVDDKIQTHRIFRDLVCGGNAFGAERWVLTLERMCERFAFASLEQIPSCDAGGVITLPEGRMNVMQLSQRMVKLFCGALDMSDDMDFPCVRVNNCGVRVSIRNSSVPGVPKGMIVTAATSLWLPLSPHTVFDFLKDPTTRDQWDVLCYENPVAQVQHISNGSHPDNCTSIIRPSIPNENSMLLLQECCTDPLGSVVVYAPVDVATVNAAMNGDDTSAMPILPSGFTIAGDGAAAHGGVGAPNNGRGHHGAKLGGSLLTLAIQVLVCSPSSMDQLNMDSVAAVNTLVTSTVEKIKAALNCSELE